MKDILEHIGIKSFEEGAKHVCFVGADKLPKGYYGTSIRREVSGIERLLRYTKYSGLTKAIRKMSASLEGAQRVFVSTWKLAIANLVGTSFYQEAQRYACTCGPAVLHSFGVTQY